MWQTIPVYKHFFERLGEISNDIHDSPRTGRFHKYVAKTGVFWINAYEGRVVTATADKKFNDIPSNTTKAGYTIEYDNCLQRNSPTTLAGSKIVGTSLILLRYILIQCFNRRTRSGSLTIV